jgi:hypothetical protein
LIVYARQCHCEEGEAAPLRETHGDVLLLHKEPRNGTETEARLLIPVNFARAAGITAKAEGAMLVVDRRILVNTKVLSGFARRHQDARPGEALANINENASEVATDRASVKARTASNFKCLSVYPRRHKAPGKGKYQGRKQGITTRSKDRGNRRADAVLRRDEACRPLQQ